MVFSTPAFLTLFLPLVLAGAWTLLALENRFARGGSRALSNLFLLASSLFFYFWGEGPGVLWLAASIVFNALCARLIAATSSPGPRKALLALGVAADLALLGVFKYAGFCARSLNLLPGVSLPVPAIALPLGISFYTFQAMSYLVDVFRRDVPPAANPLDFACYLALFPQLVAGPIVRYRDISRELSGRDITLARVDSGFARFLCGLAKKVLVAGPMGEMADAAWGVVARDQGLPPLEAWFAVAAYALEIYYDFSAYSDMAIGMGRLLGFTFPENFRHPYAATSVREFWHRWHITLSTWLRDYLYFPLGGSRCAPWRTSVNLLIVFALCGLWHGASAMFLLWGLWHGAFLLLERWLFPSRKGGAAPSADTPSRRLLLAARKLAGLLYTWSAVGAGWILFRSDSLPEAWRVFLSLFGFGAVHKEARLLWMEFTPKFLVTFALAAVFAFPLVPWARRKLAAAGRGAGAFPLALAERVVLTALGLLSGLYLAGGAYNPFLYFRF